MLTVVAVCLFLSGCSDEQRENNAQNQEPSTLTAQFVENTSESELQTIVRYANYLLIGPVASFDKADELPMLNILNMYCAVQEENAQSDQAENTLDELEDFTRSYFGAGVFDRHELLEETPITLQIEDGVVCINGFGNILGYLDGTIEIEAVLSEGDCVRIVVQIALNQAGQEEAHGELTLRVTDKGYQYAVYQFTARPWTIADLEIPMTRPLTMEQIDAYFGELQSSQIFEWEADTFGEKRLYQDRTEVMLYLGEKGSATAVIKGVTSSRADLALIKGIQIGEAIDEVIGQFLSGGYEPELADGELKQRRLYGENRHMSTYSLIKYKHNKPIEIEYAQEGATVNLYLDEEARVKTIAIVLE